MEEIEKLGIKCIVSKAEQQQLKNNETGIAQQDGILSEIFIPIFSKYASNRMSRVKGVINDTIYTLSEQV